MPGTVRPTMLAKAAAYLALLFGLIGAFAGASGASTYLPLRGANQLSLLDAQVLTLISGIGAVASVIVAWAGWGLLRGKRWALWLVPAGAVAAVAAVAAFALAMPSSSPSPVPGGAGPLVFLGVVALAYGIQLILFLLGRPRAGRMLSPASTG